MKRREFLKNLAAIVGAAVTGVGLEGMVEADELTGAPRPEKTHDEVALHNSNFDVGYLQRSWGWPAGPFEVRYGKPKFHELSLVSNPPPGCEVFSTVPDWPKDASRVVIKPKTTLNDLVKWALDNGLTIEFDVKPR